jgi:hypothetical protein
MRKSILGQSSSQPEQHSGDWLPIEEISRVEVTSEDPDSPIEHALVPGKGSGWRAAGGGTQIIRIIFDKPMPLRRIKLEFTEKGVERTQEFALRWSDRPEGQLREIVRQQWNFNPQGSTSEIEDYQVNLEGVGVVELEIKPDPNSPDVRATLSAWRMN